MLFQRRVLTEEIYVWRFEDIKDYNYEQDHSPEYVYKKMYTPFGFFYAFEGYDEGLDGINQIEVYVSPYKEISDNEIIKYMNQISEKEQSKESFHISRSYTIKAH